MNPLRSWITVTSSAADGHKTQMGEMQVFIAGTIPQNLQRRTRSASTAPDNNRKYTPSPKANVTGLQKINPADVPLYSLPRRLKPQNAFRCAGRAAGNQSRRLLKPTPQTPVFCVPSDRIIDGASARSVLPCPEGRTAQLVSGLRLEPRPSSKTNGLAGSCCWQRHLKSARCRPNIASLVSRADKSPPPRQLMTRPWRHRPDGPHRSHSGGRSSASSTCASSSCPSSGRILTPVLNSRTLVACNRTCESFRACR